MTLHWQHRKEEQCRQKFSKQIVLYALGTAIFQELLISQPIWTSLMAWMKNFGHIWAIHGMTSFGRTAGELPQCICHVIFPNRHFLAKRYLLSWVSWGWADPRSQCVIASAVDPKSDGPAHRSLPPAISTNISQSHGLMRSKSLWMTGAPPRTNLGFDQSLIGSHFFQAYNKIKNYWLWVKNNFYHLTAQWLCNEK